jgi:hypothetical protein
MRVLIEFYTDKLSVGLDMQPDEKKALRVLIKVRIELSDFQKLEQYFGPDAPFLKTMLVSTFLDPRYKGVARQTVTLAESDKVTEEERKKQKTWVKAELGPEREASVPLTDAQIAEAKSVGCSGSISHVQGKIWRHFSILNLLGT